MAAMTEQHKAALGALLGAVFNEDGDSVSAETWRRYAKVGELISDVTIAEMVGLGYVEKTGADSYSPLVEYPTD